MTFAAPCTARAGKRSQKKIKQLMGKGGAFGLPSMKLSEAAQMRRDDPKKHEKMMSGVFSDRGDRVLLIYRPSTETTQVCIFATLPPSLEAQHAPTAASYPFTLICCRPETTDIGQKRPPRRGHVETWWSTLCSD